MKGWLRSFTVEGLNLERFLRNAGNKGIGIRSVRRQGRSLSAVAEETKLQMLAELAQQGGWRFSAGKRYGTGALLDRCRRRWFLSCSAALAMILMLIGAQVMWDVVIVDAGVYEADIRNALTELGIQAPMFRRMVDTGKLRDTLEWRYPQIAWIECGWRGMVLQIRVVEGELSADDRTRDGVCDVVAAKDGIITGIVTRAGTTVVKIGEFVHAGQVLIKGEERTSAGENRHVAARGSVYARVWDAAAVTMPFTETETIYTGRQQDVLTVRTPWFDLWSMPSSGYEREDVAVKEMPLGGFFLPLMLHAEARMEAEWHVRQRETEELKSDAARAAQQKLYEITGGKESLVDNWVNWSMIKDEILLSVAYGERLMDIAQQNRDSVMAAAE